MKVLVVVDYQNDFVSGSLGFDKAKSLEPVIYDKVKQYIDNGDGVFFTLDTHFDNYLETQEGRNLPIPHCIYGTYGHNLYGRLYGVLFPDRVSTLHPDVEIPRGKVVIGFTKDTFGCYTLGETLLKLNESEEVESIEICGVVTNMCVISNAVFCKTILPEVPIIVDASACASNDDMLHEKALDVMESMQFNVVNRERV